MVKFQGYRCFSINQYRFLRLNGLKAMSKSTHPNGKIFFVFELTKELSRLLTIWSETKKDK